jgi:hypothetical protein
VNPVRCCVTARAGQFCIGTVCTGTPFTDENLNEDANAHAHPNATRTRT